MYQSVTYGFFAERAGFEPAIPFRGIHAFQACLFNHSSTSPFLTDGKDTKNTLFILPLCL